LSDEALAQEVRVRCCFMCGVCGAVCPSGAVREDAAGIRIDHSVCSHCLVCVKVCPAELIGERQVG
jgi:Pyruvate/2-oxoacid:ferredoxin oxidoreductase delta subunit